MHPNRLNFKEEYRSGVDNLIQDFYHPALKLSKQYWRAVGFFSSSAFEVIGQPLVEFAKGNGQIRLITSVHLEEKDVIAIEQGLEKRKVAEERLFKQIEVEFLSNLGDGTSLLIAMLESGKLEIQIAMPKHGYGIYHEKVGIFIINNDEYIAFTGSSNESRSGLEINYECVDIYTSWQEPKRAKSKKAHFELLWNRLADGVEVFEFPEAARKKLIKIRQNQTSPRKVTTSENDNDLWKHQKEAFNEFIDKKRGILEMATGTGKTRTSLMICQDLLSKDEVDTVIISTDGTDLLDQWYQELLEFTKLLPLKLAVLRHYSDYRERDYFLLNKKKSILLISRHFLATVLKNLSEGEASKTILIHDEVHRLGSISNRENLNGLSANITYRLGLSATPEREYDKDGNKFIEDHIGPTIYEYGLDHAIKDGILSPFNYYPIEYLPNAEDRSRLQQVHKMAVARKQSGDSMSDEEIWMRKAQVYKTSRAKLPKFRDFIKEHLDLLERCIIFVETREYGDEVLSIVHNYRADFHVYYADEDSEILKRFARGEIECLLTCHRLSEGIDIRSLETVILFSSARARLETIQRIGRCLRRNPNMPEKRANVVDFIRVSEEDKNALNINTDSERRNWLSSLSKIKPRS